MINGDIAYAYLKQAPFIYEEAEAFLQKNVWNMVVRRSQEVVELSLKAVLRHSGVEVPRLHDVSFLLQMHSEKLHSSIIANIAAIISISRRLRQER